MCVSKVFHGLRIEMNKWSTSLPSIISLCNDVQLNIDPMYMQQSTNRSTGNEHTRGSLTDVSIMIQTQTPLMNYDQYSNNSYYDQTRTHEQFVPDEQLLQSLVAYADSFELDSSIYSSVEQKPITTTISQDPTSFRRRTQSSTTHLTSAIENDPFVRHKSCEDLSLACSGTSTSDKLPTVVQRDEQPLKSNPTKFVPSESHPQFFFAAKDHNDDPPFQRNHPTKPIEDSASTSGGSRVEWGFSSDTMNEVNKPATEFFNNYEASTNIGDININYLKDLERFSSMAASMDFSPEISTSMLPTPTPPPLPLPSLPTPPPQPPPPPMIIRRKNKDFLFKQQVDIQLLRPPTPPPPAPIIIREIRHKPPPSSRPLTIHQKLENTGQIHIAKTPPPIILRERPPIPPNHGFASKPTIIYRHLPTPPPSPPTVIVERLRPHVATVIQKPRPILVEKWLPYPPEQKRKIIYERASPLPARNKRHANEQGKRIIVEYDQVNVIVDKDIKQLKEIKRVTPDRYVRQYGNSLYSNQSLDQLLNNPTSTTQVCFEEFRLN